MTGISLTDGIGQSRQQLKLTKAGCDFAKSEGVCHSGEKPVSGNQTSVSLKHTLLLKDWTLRQGGSGLCCVSANASAARPKPFLPESDADYVLRAAK